MICHPSELIYQTNYKNYVFSCGEPDVDMQMKSSVCIQLPHQHHTMAETACTVWWRILPELQSQKFSD